MMSFCRVHVLCIKDWDMYIHLRIIFEVKDDRNRITSGLVWTWCDFLTVHSCSSVVRVDSWLTNCWMPFTMSPLWHPTLTKSQAERLEAVQRRAINIIFGYSSPTPYFAILALAGIPSLQARRLDLSKRFFRKICQPTSCLHHLLPPPRDPAVTSRLRKSTLYPRPILRTKRYCSTINYALLNFQ